MIVEIGVCLSMFRYSELAVKCSTGKGGHLAGERTEALLDASCG